MKITKFALATVTLLFLYDAAYACRCLPSKPSADVSGAAAVFSGKVVKVKYELPPYELGRYTYVFEVERVWKGEKKKRVTVVTRTSSCDFVFRKGESYLVFATALTGGGGLTTRKCTRTGLVAERKEDLELLGEGSPPEGGGT